MICVEFLSIDFNRYMFLGALWSTYTLFNLSIVFFLAENEARDLELPTCNLGNKEAGSSGGALLDKGSARHQVLILR